MAFSERRAERLRGILSSHQDVHEKKMFGGLAFMTGGYMAVGVTGDDLMVRVGPDRHEEALARPGARPMDFTGKSMKGFVFVSLDNLENEVLTEWVDMALEFVAALPPKTND